jgi:serine/threonine protein kinase
MPLPSGTRLGPYEITAALGSGGMGEVYRARDTRLGREVAVKVLPGHLSRDPDLRSRFVREARLVSSLSHPHICVLHDVGREGNVDYLVMELVDGESLAERLARGPLPTGEVLRIGAQIADALDRAHRAGVIHRDLKPANVMLARSGAKLMDFGLARPSGPVGTARGTVPAPDDPARSPTIDNALTREGTLLGTYPYMAPEQLEGREADARSDIWALGCVLYEMATGRRAYEGSSPASLISAILRDDPRPMGEFAPMTPASLDRIVRACLAKDPDRRWQSAGDLAIALRWPVAEGGDSRGPAPGVVERQFVLTAAHVRQLSERNPKLVGYPVTYEDNQVQSDQLIVLLHGVGADGGRFENFLLASRHRAVALNLVGFAPRERERPILGIEDHSRILRLLLRHLVGDCRPKRTLLVGHSAGAEQFFRMLYDEAGAGIEVEAFLALGSNVSLETCFASRLYAKIDARNPGGTLTILKTLAQDIDSLETWLVVQNYLVQTFLKLGSDMEPLRRYAAEMVAPFEQPGADPLAEWYRSARRRVSRVRLVFSNEEAAPAEKLLARHLESNVLGEDFTEDSFVIEPVHHMALLDPALISRHVEEMLASMDGGQAPVPSSP